MHRPTAVVQVIVDGLSDIPPEGTATTPFLHHATRRGLCGLIDPVSPGLACGSDTAHLSIFGYDPHRHYRGRGAFEALGAKVPIRPGDIAFKCNFACTNFDGLVTARCPAKGPQMHQLAAKLCWTLNNQIGSVKGAHVTITHAGGHRCIVRLSGEGLSDAISNTDPLVDNRMLLRCKPDDCEDRSAVHTAEIVNCLSDKIHDILTRHFEDDITISDIPLVNAILLRGAAMGIDLEPFERANGLKAFLIAPTKIIAGVGKTARIDVIHVEGATGGYDTNLLAKADACVEQLMKRQIGRYEYDLGIVHVKAVDEAAHDKCAEKKAFWLENVDLMIARILRMLKKNGRDDVVLCVTGDHTSPSDYGDHTCEPVPFVLCDVFDPEYCYSKDSMFVERDECEKFCATEMGAKGSLGRFPGREIPAMFRGLIYETAAKKNKENTS